MPLPVSRVLGLTGVFAVRLAGKLNLDVFETKLSP